MQHNRRKWRIVAGMAPVAAALTAAATAFACVQTIGQLTVRGPGDSGTSTAVGSGAHPGAKNVEYCVPPTAGAVAPVPTGFAPSQRPSITVTYGPSATLCNPTPQTAIQKRIANTPVDGVYEVNFCNGKVFRDSGNGLVSTTDQSAHGSCFFSDGVTDAGVLIGTMTVAGGSGTATLKIPGDATKNGPNAFSGIAVREKSPTPTSAGGHPGPAYVNMAPLQLAVL